jgi:hypothetical protein
MLCFIEGEKCEKALFRSQKNDNFFPEGFTQRSQRGISTKKVTVTFENFLKSGKNTRVTVTHS